MGAWAISSPSEFAHYGVKGMRWGVRNDKKLQGSQRLSNSDRRKHTVEGLRQKASVAGGYSNIQRLTNNVKRQNNDDGSFNVSGLKGIKRGYFKNDSSYQKWVNGKLDLLSSNSQLMNTRMSTFENKSSNVYSIRLAERDAMKNDPDVILEFDSYEEYLKAVDDVKNQISDQTMLDLMDTKIDKIKKEKLNSSKSKSFIEKGAETVKKALDKAGKAIVSAGKAAGKKASELVDKGKKLLSSLFEKSNRSGEKSLSGGLSYSFQRPSSAVLDGTAKSKKAKTSKTKTGETYFEDSGVSYKVIKRRSSR